MGNVLKTCTCIQEEKKTDLILTTTEGFDKRVTTLKNQLTLSKRRLSLKTVNHFTDSKDINASKIQSVFRGYSYRINIFPDIKEQLILEKKDHITTLNKKFITPKLLKQAKLFELKLSNNTLKEFYKDINNEEYVRFIERASDRTERTNTMSQKSKVLVNYDGGIPISYYIGELNADSQPHGEGVLYTNSGAFYDGNFFNSEFSGYGRFMNSQGHCYEGNFIDGCINGLGTKIISKDHFYLGNFKDGLLHGSGKEENPDFIYEGNFVKDKKCGTGKIKFKNSKESYDGDFNDDCIEGYGIYVWENGQTYQGTFLNGKMSGKGIYKWKDGSIYEGDYLDGIREGKGRFTFKDGKIFVGQFKKGSPDGQGIYIIKGVEIEVEYVDGRLVGNLKDSYIRKLSGSEF